MFDFSKFQEQDRPDIIARYNLPNFELCSCGRIYVHHTALDILNLDQIKEYTINTVNRFGRLKKRDFLIAMPWADEQRNKMIDVFTSVKDNEYPGNPEKPSLYLKNGERIHSGRCCGDGELIRGVEEFYRRTPGLLFGDYCLIPPRLKGLSLLVDR